MATAVVSPAPHESFLHKVGSFFHMLLTKVLPIATEIAVAAEPFVDLALPLAGPLYNSTVAAIVQAEQAAQAAALQGAGAQKLANVIAVLGPLLEEQLLKAGVVGAAKDQAITNYINAIVALLNGPVGALLPHA